jgi:hypothetical protein
MKDSKPHEMIKACSLYSAERFSTCCHFQTRKYPLSTLGLQELNAQ